MGDRSDTTLQNVAEAEKAVDYIEMTVNVAKVVWRTDQLAAEELVRLILYVAKYGPCGAPATCCDDCEPETDCGACPVTDRLQKDAIARQAVADIAAEAEAVEQATAPSQTAKTTQTVTNLAAEAVVQIGAGSPPTQCCGTCHWFPGSRDSAYRQAGPCHWPCPGEYILPNSLRRTFNMRAQDGIYCRVWKVAADKEAIVSGPPVDASREAIHKLIQQADSPEDADAVLAELLATDRLFSREPSLDQIIREAVKEGVAGIQAAAQDGPTDEPDLQHAYTLALEEFSQAQDAHDLAVKAYVRAQAKWERAAEAAGIVDKLAPTETSSVLDKPTPDQVARRCFAKTSEEAFGKSTWLADGESVAQHTPGPWVAQYDELTVANWEIRSVARHTIATISDYCPNREADARLIAAAPDTLVQRDELLKACQTLYNSVVEEFMDPNTDDFHGSEDTREALLVVDDIIKKAAAKSVSTVTPDGESGAQHTSTPWVTTSYPDDPHHAIPIWSEGPEYEIVAMLDGANKEADAAHIVRCVNVHDDLLAAVRVAKDWLLGLRSHKDLPARFAPTPYLIGGLYDAIAKATEAGKEVS